MPSHSSVALQILSTVNYIFMTKVSVLCMFTCKKTVLNYTIFFSQEGEQGPWWCKIWKRNIFVYMYYFCLLMMGKLRKVKFIENISNFLLQYISSYLMQLISIIYNVMAGIRYTGNSHYSTSLFNSLPHWHFKPLILFRCFNMQPPPFQLLISNFRAR